MYRDCCTRCKQPLYSCSCDTQTIDFLTLTYDAQTTADVNNIRKALQPKRKPVSNPETE